MQPRFIDTGANDAFTNMAIDEALAISCQQPILRVYQWKPSAVSLGYNQNIQKEINLDYCRKNNIDVVRRLTGGKAVFHDKELTYSFIVPEKLNLLPKDIVESYKIIAQALVIALNKINITPEIKKINEKIATSVCFNSANWYELTVNDKKIFGSAQRRLDGKILQHGPILMDFDYELNNNIFNSNNKIDSIENLKQRITSLKNELKENIDINELKEKIKEGFEENFGFEFVDSSLNEKELILVEKLKKEKYSTEEWNYKLLSKTI
tara:strand:- start:3102 stop:3899 length:798 start_codon:yes stop_codon:yes gene_type:complete